MYLEQLGIFDCNRRDEVLGAFDEVVQLDDVVGDQEGSPVRVSRMTCYGLIASPTPKTIGA